MIEYSVTNRRRKMASLKTVAGPKGTVMKVKQTGKVETYTNATDTSNLSTKDKIKYGPKIREQAQKKKR